MKLFLSILFISIFHSSFSQGFSEHAAQFWMDYDYMNGEYGGGISFVDFNLDGWDDITVATGNGMDIKFHQNNAGTLVEIAPLVTNVSEVKQVLWIDIDNDADLDLYVASKLENKLYENTGNMVFVDITQTCGFDDPSVQSFCATWFDYDKDGLPDICVGHRTAFLIGDLTLYHNLGDGQFEDVTSAAGLTGVGNSTVVMTSLDYDNDGWSDLYIGQDHDQGNIMFRNNGDGTFENTSESTGTNVENDSMSATVGDYDNDGDMDIYLTNNTTGNTLYRNEGNGTFTNAAASMGLVLNKFSWGAVFLDADCDMDLDIHINGIASFPFSSYMLQNPGNGLAYSNANVAWGFGTDANYSVGLGMGDYNGDGKPDLMKNNSTGTLNTLWRNNFTTNHHLTIDLVAEVSNRFAIGAIIEVTIGGITQTKRLACGEGFSSQHSYTQFFGAGSNVVIDEINVYWPSGIVTSVNNIPSNQRITLYEITAGCMDDLACNFNAAANEEDGSCEYAPEYYNCSGGCTNDIDVDGVCDELEILGCMDEQACNYSADATDDNGLCDYAESFYNCAGVCLTDIDEDGVCDELEIVGCNDEAACNYQIEATDNDGSCEYPELYLNCEGNCIMDTDEDGICDELEIVGCYDPEACNFNANATDEGDCEYVELFEIEGSDLAFAEEAAFTYTYPSTPGSVYNWSTLLNTSIVGQGNASVDITWLEEGSEFVTIVETTEDGCTGEAVSYEVFVLWPGIEENETPDFYLFPNPASDQISISLKTGSSIGSFYLTNSLGQSVLFGKIQSQTTQVNTSTLPPGFYMLTIQTTDHIQTKTLEIR
ncbi:MAG: FG-GAP-like repeat-containing protein [Flavobacteriales bacterium]|nr:FG-GAP-like repeat-containing protein [Flavobacteriales bacterium]